MQYRFWKWHQGCCFWKLEVPKQNQLDISTSKSGPRMVCFVHLWLQNVLRATTPCTFSTSQLPKALRSWGVCAFWLRNALRVTTACNFWSLISPDGSALAAFASLLFDHPEPQNIGKTSFLPFRMPWSSFYWSSFDWLFLFWLFLFSASSHLCCFICPYCRKFCLLNFLLPNTVEYSWDTRVFSGCLRILSVSKVASVSHTRIRACGIITGFLGVKPWKRPESQRNQSKFSTPHHSGPEPHHTDSCQIIPV